MSSSLATNNAHPSKLLLLQADPLGPLYPPVPGLGDAVARRADTLLLQFWHGAFLQVFADSANETDDGFVERFDMLFDMHRKLLPATATDPAAVACADRVPWLMKEWLEFLDDPRKSDKFSVGQTRRRIAYTVRRCGFLSISVLEEPLSRFRQKMGLHLARLARNSFRMTSKCEHIGLFIEGFAGFPTAVFAEASKDLVHSCAPNCSFECMDGKLLVYSLAQDNTPPSKPWTINFAPHFDADAFGHLDVWKVACGQDTQTAQQNSNQPHPPTSQHTIDLALKFGASKCECGAGSRSLNFEVGKKARVCHDEIVRRCGKCDKWTDRPMPRCGSCKVQLYCDAQCQKADWTKHKPVCGKMKSMLEPLPLVQAVFECVHSGQR
jgi:hypothetical protein